MPRIVPAIQRNCSRRLIRSRLASIARHHLLPGHRNRSHLVPCPLRYLIKVREADLKRDQFCLCYGRVRKYVGCSVVSDQWILSNPLVARDQAHLHGLQRVRHVTVVDEGLEGARLLAVALRLIVALLEVLLLAHLLVPPLFRGVALVLEHRESVAGLDADQVAGAFDDYVDHLAG